MFSQFRTRETTLELGGIPVPIFDQERTSIDLLDF